MGFVKAWHLLNTVGDITLLPMVLDAAADSKTPCQARTLARECLMRGGMSISPSWTMCHCSSSLLRKRPYPGIWLYTLQGVGMHHLPQRDARADYE